MDYTYQKTKDGFNIRNGMEIVAQTRFEHVASEICRAMNVLQAICSNHGGVIDGDSPVNGADLVESVTCAYNLRTKGKPRQ